MPLVSCSNPEILQQQQKTNLQDFNQPDLKLHLPSTVQHPQSFFPGLVWVVGNHGSSDGHFGTTKSRVSPLGQGQARKNARISFPFLALEKSLKKWRDPNRQCTSKMYHACIFLEVYDHFEKTLISCWQTRIQPVLVVSVTIKSHQESLHLVEN